MKLRVKKIVLAILLILWMITVFWFSNQGADDSSDTSGNTIRAIINLIPSIRQMESAEKEKIVSDLQPYARKLAHYTMYTIGGIIAFLNVKEYFTDDEKRIAISIIIGSTYSITDEFHQMFVDGRAGEFKDIVIDTLGVCLGIAIMLIIVKIKERRLKNG